MKKNGYVKIYSTLNIAEAHTVKFLFENNGIEAVIENQEMNPLFGMVAARDAEAQVWVPEGKSGMASAVLAGASSIDLDHIKLATCRNCGELVCDRFDYCWNCMATMKTGKVDRERFQPDDAVRQARFPALYILFIIIIVLMLLGFIASRFFRGG
ncbi:MAG: DUF2007 domain-containing protein [Spirochaetes bacterium]|nr:DUF2007 domain-containing protein [Spirochaetota bacterium]